MQNQFMRLWPIIIFYYNPPVRNTEPKYKHRLQAVAIFSFYTVQETVMKLLYFVNTIPHINTKQQWRRTSYVCALAISSLATGENYNKYTVRITTSDKTFILSFVKIGEVVQPFTRTETHTDVIVIQKPTLSEDSILTGCYPASWDECAFILGHYVPSKRRKTLT
jgi:hypothetical protein